MAAPFLTWLETDPDFNKADCDRAFEQMRERNRAIQSLIDGTLSAEDLLDLLEGTGVNPTEYANAVQGAVEAFVKR